VNLLLAIVLAPLILLTFCFAVELFFGIRPLARQLTTDPLQASSVVIVPAHDEEAMIRARLATLKSATNGIAQILVVADNCRDSTAAIARELGVDVVERFDADRRGKGFALDFARSSLQSSPVDVVLIVDADCEMDAGSIRRLAARCFESGQPCQAVNLQIPPPGASPAVQLSTFAFFIKNVVRQRALQRLAHRVHLLGTGMALPWSAFIKADLATDNIAEDMKIGVELAEAGHVPLFVEDAAVWSNAETEKGTLTQRSRWEGGFLRNALQKGPRMLVRSLARGDLRESWAALDVLIPPFALLLLLDVGALLLSLVVATATGASMAPALVLAGSLGLAVIGLAAAWASGGSRFVSLSGLGRAPLYVLWKLPMYLGLARRGAPKEWLRTRGGKS
jgi:cellulose synthase/poly-beta-1,6-N-acetylglucosamine synthase-like glycosyltransferase